MLTIQSQGEIDTNALRLMGASVKGDDAIGEFGSGLKYAIACLIRAKVDLRIYSGLREIKITTVKESFRGSDFEVIIIDGERTSLTTRTGPKWKSIEAVRELWSNALDEGQARRATHIPPTPGFTTIMIGECASIRSMLENWDQYFLGDVPAVFTSGKLGSIHEQRTTNFFRKGVWICQESQQLPLFSYNFSGSNCPSLPESRLVSVQACKHNLVVLLSVCDSLTVATKLLQNVHKDTLEWPAFRYYSYTPAPTLKNTLVDAFYKLGYTHAGLLRSRELILDRIASDQHVLWCREDAFSVLVTDIGLPSIEQSLGFNDRYEIRPWPIGVKELVDEHVAFLAAAGIRFPKETEFHYAHFKAEEVLAQADIRNQRCLLSPKVANSSSNQLIQALIEEWTHLEHGVADRTIEQQHVYLNLITELLGCVPSRS